MLKGIHERRFNKDCKLAKKRGKNLKKLEDIMILLCAEKPLPFKNQNHKLRGYLHNDTWECHIESDWLLIYKKNDNEIIFARTGSHFDYFALPVYTHLCFSSFIGF